ncbi:hypothetical protein ZWY2020_007491 [Hordeum vulgare]|nr:hypothetical protein ZWY2020_007491 [Hordeum vulgare]
MIGVYIPRIVPSRGQLHGSLSSSSAGLSRPRDGGTTNRGIRWITTIEEEIGENSVKRDEKTENQEGSAIGFRFDKRGVSSKDIIRVFRRRNAGHKQRARESGARTNYI